MTLTSKNLLSHEIIGLKLNVLESSDPTITGLTGTVIDETKNTLFIRIDSSRIIQISKQVATRLQVDTDNGVCFISGSSLIGRPEDRISRSG